MSEHCPSCKSGLLEFRSGTFGSGVFHPDGTEETLYEEFSECDRCGRKFDENDLDELVRDLGDQFPSEGHYTFMSEEQQASQPQTYDCTVRICKPCVELQGQECHTPECIFFLRSMAEVKHYLDVMLLCPVIRHENGDEERIVLVPHEPDLSPVAIQPTAEYRRNAENEEISTCANCGEPIIKEPTIDHWIHELGWRLGCVSKKFVATPLQPPSLQSETKDLGFEWALRELADGWISNDEREGPYGFYQNARRVLTLIANDVAQLQREVDAGIKFATVIPVGHSYSVAVGTKEAGVGIRMCETLMDAQAICDAINARIAAAIRAAKQQ